MEKKYQPDQVEKKWYDSWQEKNCFNANENSKKQPYSIVIPPPNVTGVLHIGHVLNNTIQDILARRARLQGKEVLWLPGTDHAGIATQTKVEKKLIEQGTSLEKFGREKFLQQVWQWKDEHGGIIIQQLKKLGCSLDWQRLRFTMDDQYSDWISYIFIKLFHENKIYKGKRMVNWCPASQTALSDEEVIMKKSKSKLYYVNYRIDNSDKNSDYDFIQIATTRPETIIGDVAIAVNPADKRYQKLIGKFAIRPLPLTNQAKIPIIADEKVEKDFGTGALKITPAHDNLDFEIGTRHNLPTIDILFPDGCVNCPEEPALHKLDRQIARQKSAEILAENSYLAKTEDYENNVGYSERANVPIEPRLSEQWFLKSPCVEQAQEVVKKAEIKFRPEHWQKTYAHWLDNIKDWCISRQLWWGHRIPIWSKTVKSSECQEILEKIDIQKYLDNGQSALKVFRGSEIICPDDAQNYKDDITIFIGALSEELITKLEKENFVHDEDVLDTWFSSWLWPFATMADPPKSLSDQSWKSSKLLQKFYPTSDLVTGPDIIFFWVARMIMAGIYEMQEIPFKNVFFTSIVRDIQGRKMSKSLGNSPEPMDLMAKYGADGLRFGLMRISPVGQDVHFDEKQIEEGRNFATKLWNAIRFRQMFETPTSLNLEISSNTPAFALHILNSLRTLEKNYENAFEQYKFNEAANLLYQFFWSDFCDIFLESAKHDFQKGGKRADENFATFDFAICKFLPMLHPFMPHITEEIWEIFDFKNILDLENPLMTTDFSAPHLQEKLQNPIENFNPDKKNEILLFADRSLETVKKLRNLKAEYNLTTNKDLTFFCNKTEQEELFPSEMQTLAQLIGCKEIKIDEKFTAEKNVPTALTELGEFFMPMTYLIDVSAERLRIKKELDSIKAEIKRANAKLNNKNFMERAPAEIVAQEKQRKGEWLQKQEKLKNIFAILQAEK